MVTSSQGVALVPNGHLGLGDGKSSSRKNRADAMKPRALKKKLNKNASLKSEDFQNR